LYPIYPQPNGSGFSGNVKDEFLRFPIVIPDRFAAAATGKFLLGPHTSHFEPGPGPTLSTGIKSLAAVVISLLRSPEGSRGADAGKAITHMVSSC